MSPAYLNLPYDSPSAKRNAIRDKIRKEIKAEASMLRWSELIVYLDEQAATFDSKDKFEVE